MIYADSDTFIYKINEKEISDESWIDKLKINQTFNGIDRIFIKYSLLVCLIIIFEIVFCVYYIDSNDKIKSFLEYFDGGNLNSGNNKGVSLFVPLVTSLPFGLVIYVDMICLIYTFSLQKYIKKDSDDQNAEE